MSRQCERCERGPLRAASRSHSNIKTIRRQMINLQRRHVDGKRMHLCTRCIKTIAKTATT